MIWKPLLCGRPFRRQQRISTSAIGMARAIKFRKGVPEPNLTVTKMCKNCQRAMTAVDRIPQPVHTQNTGSDTCVA